MSLVFRLLSLLIPHQVWLKVFLLRTRGTSEDELRCFLRIPSLAYGTWCRWRWRKISFSVVGIWFYLINVFQLLEKCERLKNMQNKEQTHLDSFRKRQSTRATTSTSDIMFLIMRMIVNICWRINFHFFSFQKSFYFVFVGRRKIFDSDFCDSIFPFILTPTWTNAER